MWCNIQFFPLSRTLWFTNPLIYKSSDSHLLNLRCFFLFSRLSSTSSIQVSDFSLSSLPYPPTWIRNTLLNSPALLSPSQFRFESSICENLDLPCRPIFATASSTFTYPLRDFFLSELGLCDCQRNHLLSQTPSILIACRYPNAAFVLSNALQKLFVPLCIYLWYLYNSSFVNTLRLSLWYLSSDVILCNHLLYLALLFFLCVIV